MFNLNRGEVRKDRTKGLRKGLIYLKITGSTATTNSHATPQPVKLVNIFRLHAESVRSHGPVTGQRIVLAISTKDRTIQHDLGTEMLNYGNNHYSTYSISYTSVIECDKPLDTAAEMVKVSCPYVMVDIVCSAC